MGFMPRPDPPKLPGSACFTRPKYLIWRRSLARNVLWHIVELSHTTATCLRALVIATFIRRLSPRNPTAPKVFDRTWKRERIWACCNRSEQVDGIPIFMPSNPCGDMGGKESYFLHTYTYQVLWLFIYLFFFFFNKKHNISMQLEKLHRRGTRCLQHTPKDWDSKISAVMFI